MADEFFQTTRPGMPGQIDEVSRLLGTLLSEVSALKQGQAKIEQTIREAVAMEYSALEKRVVAVEAEGHAATALLASYRTTGRNALAAAGLLGTLFGAFLIDLMTKGLKAAVAFFGGPA